jgi:hypothetical protein
VHYRTVTATFQQLEKRNSSHPMNPRPDERAANGRPEVDGYGTITARPLT